MPHPAPRRSHTALASGTILLIVTLNLLAYTGRLPLWALDWPGSDKVIHCMVYAALTASLILRLGKRRVRTGPVSVPLVLLSAVLMAVVDEGAQALSPARSLELLDLLSDLVGISLAWFALRSAAGDFSPSEKPR